MEIKYEIADDKIRNFTDEAKHRLIEQSQKYTLSVISEAEKLEELIRENGASSEITDNIIFQAVRRYKTGRKKNYKIIILRIVSEFFLCIFGIMIIPDAFISSDKTLNMGYFCCFLFVSIIAVSTTIASHFLGDE